MTREKMNQVEQNCEATGDIKEISVTEFNEIVETGKPKGLFYVKEGDQYIGLNNSTGKALAKDFDTLEECGRWLRMAPEAKDKKIREIIEEQIRHCLLVLLEKNDEYSTEEDYFHNFKVAAEMQNTTMPQALAGMMAKHTSSIYDLCKDYGTKQIPLEVWNEKITDHINYLLLLKAMVTMLEREEQ